MRRLPVFFVLDVSESMVGEPLRLLESGLERIVRTLRTDPHALETVHVSVIAFAGKAEVVVLLIDLVSFYPPRMPIGGGTALGEALILLMDEIDKQVVKTTYEQRGDWEPVCFLITDGKPTDNPSAAVDRWLKDYASRAQIVAITLGRAADMMTLTRLTPNAFALEQSSDTDFKRFIDWVTASVATQSHAVETGNTGARINLEKTDKGGLTLIKDGDAALMSDPDFVIMSGRCQRTKRPYLMKYAKIAFTEDMRQFVNTDRFGLEGCYPIEESYFDWTCQGHTEEVNTSVLEGAPPCPHCGNATAFARCGCGKLMCVNGPGVVECPWCGKACEFGEGGGSDFNVSRAQG